MNSSSYNSLILSGFLGLVVGGALSYLFLSYSTEVNAKAVSDARPSNLTSQENNPSFDRSDVGQVLIEPRNSSSKTPLSKSFGEVLNQGPGFPQYYALYQLANQATVNDLPNLIEQSLALQDSFLQFGFTTVFLEKFTYLSPQLALRFVLEDLSTQKENYYNWARIVFREWIRLDQDEALANLKNIDDRNLKISITMSLAQEKDILSEKVQDELVKTLPLANQQFLRQAAIRRQSPQQLFENAINNKNRRERESALYTAANRWAKDNPLEFMDVLYLKHDQGLITKTELNNLTRTTLNTWGQQDFEAAFEYAKLVEGQDNSDLVVPLIIGLTASNPEKAADLARQLENTNMRNRNALASVYSLWGDRDIKGLLDYIGSNALQPDSVQMQTIASAYARSYPIEALEWAVDKGKAAVSGVASGLEDADLKTLEQYYLSLEAGPLKQQLVSVLATKKSAEDPLDGLAWLGENILDKSTPYYENARHNIMYQWMHNDPAGFANYLVSENEASDLSLLPSLMNGWLSVDKQSAKQWLNTLPVGQFKNRALSSYSRVLSSNVGSAEEVIAIIDQITSREERESSATNVVYSWISHNSDGADKIIQRYGLNRQSIEQKLNALNLVF